MPEGPSLVILKEKISFLKGKKIIAASGYADIDYSKLENKKITDIKTWGKHLFICLKDINIEIHLRLFGSYLLNERKLKINSKLRLEFATDELNFYVTDVKLVPNLAVFDWHADVMSGEWSIANAKKKLKKIPEIKLCDALMDQKIFSGVGNIIKNELLWRAKLHPEKMIRDITAPKLTALLKDAAVFSFEFLKYKKAGTLLKHCNAYQKKACSRCKVEIVKEDMGKGKRGTYYCPRCQT